MRIYCRFLWDSGQDIRLFWVLSFGVGWRCSAGSQIFFLDKESETGQKKLLLRRNIFSHKKIEKFTKATKSMPFIHDFVWFGTQYHVILSFEFWGRMKVLCGVPDIFPWQNIWDLSRTFQLSRNICSHNEIGKYTKVTRSVELFTILVILCTIPRYSEFWDFVSDEGALRGLRYFSLTNNLRLVKKNSALQKYLLSQENQKIL